MNLDIYKKEYDFSLNIFSWVILVTYLCVSFIMQVYPSGVSLEGPLFTLPVICLMMYWSEKKACLLKKHDSKLTKKNKFQRNFFIIFFAINIGSFISLIFQYNNSDIRGIWPISTYFTFFCSIAFSLLFSIISYALPIRKSYLVAFSFVIFTIFSISKFWPYYMAVPYIGQINFYTVVMMLLILIHLLFSFTLMMWLH